MSWRCCGCSELPPLDRLTSAYASVSPPESAEMDVRFRDTPDASEPPTPPTIAERTSSASVASSAATSAEEAAVSTSLSKSSWSR
eukprot:scaffold206373_cov28-Tisochrysis_lutea.AAC.1